MMLLEIRSKGIFHWLPFYKGKVVKIVNDWDFHEKTLPELTEHVNKSLGVKIAMEPRYLLLYCGSDEDPLSNYSIEENFILGQAFVPDEIKNLGEKVFQFLKKEGFICKKNFVDISTLMSGVLGKPIEKAYAIGPFRHADINDHYFEFYVLLSGL